MRSRERVRMAMLALALVLAAPAAHADGVWLGMTPATAEVAPGAVFDLDLTVTQAGPAFNGFDAVIGYDPAALTLLPRTPTSQQQGALMTGACPNLFHIFRAGSGTDTIASVLLCSGVSVTGPGQIYRLRFQASGTPQVTQVRFLEGVQFYQAGAYLDLAAASGAVIGIGMPVSAPAPGPAAGGLALAAAPNPARGAIRFMVTLPSAGPFRVRLSDLQGREVRRLEGRADAPGPRTLTWDGHGGDGAPLPPGIYLARLESAAGAVTLRVARVR